MFPCSYNTYFRSTIINNRDRKLPSIIQWTLIPSLVQNFQVFLKLHFYEGVKLIECIMILLNISFLIIMGELENTNSDCRFEFNMVRIPLGISFNKLRFPVENFHTSSSYDVISVFRF